MCGGCNVWAESAGVSLIVARYWWVARQGTKAVAAAEAITRTAIDSPAATVPRDVPAEFVDPMADVVRVI